MQKPRIGITNCSKIDDYKEAVRAGGGEPVVIDWNTTSADEALSSVRGVVLTGGPDVDPAEYGESPHSSVQRAENGRDRFELELSRRLLEQDVPLLAICRGMQVLNIAAGGTLIQDIPSALASSIDHSMTSPKDRIAHEVEVISGTRTWQLLGRKDRRAVNSRHHQAVDRIGKGFLVTATAPDAVIEAMERPDRRFCVAVQWHPENFSATGEFRSLFEGLVQAAEGQKTPGHREGPET
jgi:putative glutamine amidotransferase